jgi:methanethiol oxidase
MATLLRADPTFYASPRLAMQAPPETVAYVIVVNPGKGPDGLAVLDADRSSKTYGTVVNTLTTTHAGDELHHFGWNACSGSLT